MSIAAAVAVCADRLFRCGRGRGHMRTLACRCTTPHEADVWFQSLHSCTESLMTQANAEVNLMLGGNPEVKLMGWLGEKVPITQASNRPDPMLGQGCRCSRTSVELVA